MHMSAIGSILLARGVRVTGSDIASTAFTERLKAEGATIHQGHDAAYLDDPDLVVATVAAKESNPELAAARERGIPIVIRAEMVAALMQGLRAVCVAGTHGKTTTSSLLAFALRRAGRDPTYLLGGDSVDLGRNAAPGGGAEIVVEADEYAEAFLHYTPDLAVVTNVEVDHLDYYGTEQRLVGAFREFLARVRPGGLIVACADSPRLRTLIDGDAAAHTGITARIARYALDRDAGWTARVDEGGETQRFTVAHEGRSFGSFSTPLAGRHNVANCLGAIAALHALDVEREQIVDAIAGFHGARRRFERVGEQRGIIVMDDYAHHPTEIAATIAAARERFAGRRLVVVFQPHTYSRTSYLLEGFRDCFAGADLLLLLQTYAARETAEAGLDATELAASLEQKPPVAADEKGAVAWLLDRCRAGDLVMTMGAGTVDAVGRALLEALQ
jgi:UDP-N-acetylmuramate--alanine ligase